MRSLKLKFGVASATRAFGLATVMTAAWLAADAAQGRAVAQVSTVTCYDPYYGGGSISANKLPAGETAYYYTPCPENPGAAIDKIAGERVRNMVQNAQFARILLGSYEQINCINTCISAFGSVGSFSAGFHGRKYLTDRLSILGGFSINEYKSGTVSSRSALIAAMALRYDFVDWGKSRPFFEFGGSMSPTEKTKSVRTYTVAGLPFVSAVKARSETYMVYGRMGWVWRVTPRDEFSIFGDLVRQWHIAGRATETGGVANPFPAVYLPGTDTMNVVRITAQHVHLFGSRVELHVNAGVSHSFDVQSGLKAVIAPLGLFTPTLQNKTWFEYGARVGFRINKSLTLDTFLIGASGPKPIGNSLHGGMGIRAVF
ncbi:MAG: hypothetical protein AB7F96_00555 [Beijerinckiaceae bacterium]